MIISFGWTTRALLAGHKTVTRRDWSERHALLFHEGMICDAWNAGPRVVQNDPHKVAIIRLTNTPRREYTRDAPAEDWRREGFEYLEQTGGGVGKRSPRDVWAEWTMPESHLALWVVRFEVVEYLEGPVYERA